jgi:hypothetical protein
MLGILNSKDDIHSCCRCKIDLYAHVRCVRVVTDVAGFYSFWPGSSATSAISSRTLINAPNTESLQDCLTKCTYHQLCAGVRFGPLVPNTTALQVIAGGMADKCQLIQVQTDVTGLRTVLKARVDALRPW